MMAKKKTSIELDENLWREAKMWAAHEDKSFGALLADALRVYIDRLARVRKLGVKTFTTRQFRAKKGGLR